MRTTKKNIPLKKQATAIFIGSMLGTVLRFLMPVVIIRLISQNDYGIFRQFLLVGSTFMGFLDMGYKSSLFYFFPITNFKGRQKIIQQTELLLLVNLIIFLIIFIIFGDDILTYLNFENFIEVKFLIVIFISFTILSSVVESIFTLEKNLLLNKIYHPLEKIVRFIVFLIVIFIIPGYEGPIYALLVYSLLRFLFFIYYIFPYLKNSYKLDFKLIKKQLVYSLPFGVALILITVSTTFDKFLINKYITPEEFAIYAICFLSIPILKQFFKSIHNVVVPEIAILMDQNKIKEASLLWKKTVDKTSSVTIPAVFIFWILANEIITILYTPEYIEAVKYYRIIILVFLVSMFSHEIILRGANKTKYILLSTIIGTIITLTLGFIIIPKYGVYGAAITSLIATITPMIVSLLIEKKIMGLKFKEWVNWKQIIINIIICLLISVPIFLVKDYISNIYFRTIISVLVFVLFLVPLQIKYDIFIFNDSLMKIKKFISCKLKRFY